VDSHGIDGLWNELYTFNFYFILFAVNSFGERFCALSDAYDKKLRVLAWKVAHELEMSFVHEGIYMCQVGPCFETVAECRMMLGMGADAAGKSANIVFLRHHI